MNQENFQLRKVLLGAAVLDEQGNVYLSRKHENSIKLSEEFVEKILGLKFEYSAKKMDMIDYFNYNGVRIYPNQEHLRIVFGGDYSEDIIKNLKNLGIQEVRYFNKYREYQLKFNNLPLTQSGRKKLTEIFKEFKKNNE
jgi:hypothetical protein